MAVLASGHSVSTSLCPCGRSADAMCIFMVARSTAPLKSYDPTREMGAFLRLHVRWLIARACALDEEYAIACLNQGIVDMGV